MNKKIKIIDLLNKIANKEEIPRHIKYEHYEYDWSDKANDYICENADGERLSMFDDGYICILCNSLTDEVEILEDNTEEIETIKTLYGITEPEIGWENEGRLLKYLTELREKVNELAKAVNKLKGDKE